MPTPVIHFIFSNSKYPIPAAHQNIHGPFPIQPKKNKIQFPFSSSNNNITPKPPTPCTSSTSFSTRTRAHKHGKTSESSNDPTQFSSPSPSLLSTCSQRTRTVAEFSRCQNLLSLSSLLFKSSV